MAMYRARSNAQAVSYCIRPMRLPISTLIGEGSPNAVHTAAFYVRAGRVPMIKYHPSRPLRCMKPWRRWRRITMRSSCASTALTVAGADMSVAARCRGGGGAVLPDCRCDRFEGRQPDG